MKKLFIVGAVLILMSSLVVGCGQEEEKQAAAPAESGGNSCNSGALLLDMGQVGLGKDRTSGRDLRPRNAIGQGQGG